MRYFLEVAYNGLAFHGSQIQGELPTVQLSLNKALSTILRDSIETYGASRTDAEVHAKGNYYHFDWDTQLVDNFVYRLNAVLPPEIAVLRCCSPRANTEANCRFDALKRTYHYQLYTTKNPFQYKRAHYYPYTLQKELLHATAQSLLGEHDFTSFSKRNTQSHTFICTIHDAAWVFEDNAFHFEVTANRFLRGMVRAFTSTQLQVARGHLSLEDFLKIRAQKDCRLADFSVPGFGLYLEHIHYPENYFSERF